MNILKFRQTLLLFVAIITLNTSVQALDNVRFVLESDGKAFALYLTSQVEKAIEISIQDKDGVILWEDNFEAKGEVAKKFDLNQLPNGQYFARISDATKIIVQPLIIKKGIIEITGKDREVRYKPVFNQKDRQLDLNWFTAGKKVRLVMTDSEGNIVLQDQFENGATLHKRFNLEQLPAGSYTFKMTTQEATYYHQMICR